MFDAYLPVSVVRSTAYDQYWEGVKFLYKKETFSKNTILKDSDENENNIRFVLKGSVGVFSQLGNGNDSVCTDICLENSYAFDYRSVLLNQKSPTVVKTLEYTEILVADVDKLWKVSESEIGLRIFRAAAELSFLALRKQQIELLSKPAEDRYYNLFIENPLLIQRIPQHVLASYLGITTQSLSRIRAKADDRKKGNGLAE